ncbi:unnamed protein product, partial [Cuscuta europaea]
MEDEVRPQVSDIEKNFGWLDKELAASGFTRKDQDDIEKFIEVENVDTPVSDDEGYQQKNEPATTDLKSLKLDEKEEDGQNEESKSVLKNSRIHFHLQLCWTNKESNCSRDRESTQKKMLKTGPPLELWRP